MYLLIRKCNYIVLWEKRRLQNQALSNSFGRNYGNAQQIIYKGRTVRLYVTFILLLNDIFFYNEYIYLKTDKMQIPQL